MAYLRCLILGAASAAVCVCGFAAFDFNAPQAQLGPLFCIVFGALGAAAAIAGALIELIASTFDDVDEPDEDPWELTR